MTFPEFLAKWTNPAGQRVDYDHVYSYQCVDLILEYVYECAGLASGVHGNAIDYWNKPAAVLLTKFVKIQTQDVQAGDITVLTSPITSLGHIGIATGAISGTQFQMMEQNGSTGNGSGVGGDAIRTRFIPKSRIVGVLRPISVAPSVPMINLDQLTQLYRDILQRAPDNGGIAHYVGHYTYDFVRNDMLNSAEYKSIQANQAAAAQAAIEAAQTPPPPVIPMPPSAPAGALQVPTSTTRYLIRTTIRTYSTVSDAQAGTNSKGEILVSSSNAWYVYCEKGGMVNITQTPGVTTGTWINPADNKVPDPTPPPAVVPAAPVIPPPTPAPKIETETDIRHSFIPIMPDGSPVACQVLRPILVVDTLGRGESVTVTPKTGDIHVYGTFKAASRIYALVKTSNRVNQNNYMYGIPITAPDDFSPFLKDVYAMSDSVIKAWELVYDKAYKTIEGIYRTLVKK